MGSFVVSKNRAADAILGNAAGKGYVVAALATTHEFVELFPARLGHHELERYVPRTVAAFPRVFVKAVGEKHGDRSDVLDTHYV